MKKLIEDQGVWKKSALEAVKTCKKTVDPPIKPSDYTDRINILKEMIRKLQAKPKPEVKKEEAKKEEAKKAEAKKEETKKESAEKMQDTKPGEPEKKQEKMQP